MRTVVPEMLIGTSALPKADADMMHEAGIGWVRQGFPFPFSDRVGGHLTDRYRQAKADAEARVAGKLEPMGVTSLPFGGKHEPQESGSLHLK